MRRLLLLILVAVPAVLGQRSPAHAAGTWTWPVSGQVVRGYDPPQDPFGSGHRGIDVAASTGSPVHAVTAGTVTFAGRVAGEHFVTVHHGGGLASTYSWVSSVAVQRDDLVAQGQVIAISGGGHPGATGPPHLHLGVKRDGQYVDPLEYLAPLSVVGMIRLAPLPVGP